MSDRVSSRAREVAERLFELMTDFDHFDVTLHNIEHVVENLDEDLAREVLVHYDLVELARQCRHYASVLTHIARTIDEVARARSHRETGPQQGPLRRGLR
jgi:DNA anti-recombination protein RmuC